MKVWPGKPYPLGATWDGVGVNFALYSEHASSVELCFFDFSGAQTARLKMVNKTGQIFHCYIPDTRPGQLYGYRVDGPYEPEKGMRFNPNKLLLDPYAKAIAGDVRWDDAVYGYTIGDERKDLSFDNRDSAPFVPKSVVVDSAFSWYNDEKPNIPLNKTVIYELHVKGISILNPLIPSEFRGTYAAVASEEMVRYLKSLNITAVELMPVHHFVHDRTLIEKGLTNYWGYNTIGFFAPYSGYSSSGIDGQQVQEFKTMVKTLHSEGIEVILDVVYNHTAEGNHMGPTLSFRGIDNYTYYRLVNDTPRYYMDYTGTGNTPRMTNPYVLQLIMDSLRYWITEMHVDGFRFDLASSLAREFYEVDRLGAFFDIIHQDPVISNVKLIAEPWDLGPGGYQVGNFPSLWAEWNGKYRDTVRHFLKGDKGYAGEMAYRLTGSSDLYEQGGRKPYASINFITAHDGFALQDLVSYNGKHNEANKEENRDGSNDNISWNHGVEGTTADSQIVALRERQKRNFMSTLLFSQDVAMILHGDELSRTKKGNNNTYCQDNELSWLNWNLDDQERDFLDFTRYVLSLRTQHSILQKSNYFIGKDVTASGRKDITWLKTDGSEMKQEDWKDENICCFGMILNGDSDGEKDSHGAPLLDDTLMVLFNSNHTQSDFIIPKSNRKWAVILDTKFPRGQPDESRGFEGKYRMEPYSVALLLSPLPQKWSKVCAMCKLLG